MHRGGEVLVNELGVAVADDDIAIGSLADRCLLSGLKQKFFWNVSNIDHNRGTRRRMMVPSPFHFGIHR